jgi:antitoxin component of RelBE/YafQ-DinJ toxin-antitoxin module
MKKKEIKKRGRLVQLRLDEKTDEKLEAICKSLGLPRTFTIIYLINKYKE